MRNGRPASRSGFTLVELTVVVVISSIALVAIYQTLITQERTFRYQSAAIETQGSTRMALQVLASELREASASAGLTPATTGGSDLLMTARDSIRFRAFRKVGITCAFDRALGTVDVWVPGSSFEARDRLLIFQEGDSITDDDDRWASVSLPGVSGATNEAACRAEWNAYPVQGLTGLLATTATMERGALIRSFEILSFGAMRYDGEWVLGRINDDGTRVPLVGPLLSPDSGGIRFRYFTSTGTELTPTTEAQRAQVARVRITVRALSRGGIDGPYVDSLTTNVYLRGN